MPNAIDRVRDALLVQCLPPEAHLALQVAHRPGTGVVVTTRDRSTVRAVAAAADGIPLLVDAARYAGKARLAASAEFDRDWLAVQRAAGLPVLTDSGYVHPRDVQGLLGILQRTADLDDAVAVLALGAWWFDPRGGLEALLEHVGRIGVPIAVALEHRDDPLGVARTLRGLLALLDVDLPVIQLRCDVSGLGLLCHGAWASAVGTRTSLRHLYPVTAGGARPRSPSVATVVAECLAYVTVDRIALAVQADPENSLWRECTCRACLGRQLDWISRLTVPEEQHRAAFTHAVEALAALRDHLTATPRAADRQLSWRAHCDAALARYDEMAQGWKPPASLRRWYELPVPTRTAAG